MMGKLCKKEFIPSTAHWHHRLSAQLGQSQHKVPYLHFHQGRPDGESRQSARIPRHAVPYDKPAGRCAIAGYSWQVQVLGMPGSEKTTALGHQVCPSGSDARHLGGSVGKSFLVPKNKYISDEGSRSLRPLSYGCKGASAGNTTILRPAEGRPSLDAMRSLAHSEPRKANMLLCEQRIDVRTLYMVESDTIDVQSWHLSHDVQIDTFQCYASASSNHMRTTLQSV